MRALSVLVVDDDPFACEFVVFQLRALGVTTLIAGSGREALAVLRTSVPDGVLTDLFLSEETCANLVAACASLGIPVAVMTGSPGQVRRELGDVPMPMVLGKPFGLQQLEAFIRGIDGAA